MSSLWLDSVKLPQFESLNKNISTEVCIIGGGITGISLGYKLKNANIPFALIEKDTIASKSTGHTTAKITSQHDLIYHYLENAYSEKFARDYLYANQEAIEDIATIINKENIDCDFKRQSSYIFTNDPLKVNDIANEYKTLKKFDIDVELVNKLDIPVKMLSAIKLNHQAQFTPTKYIAGLTKCFGHSIYENTVAIKISKKGDHFIVKTSTGNEIICKKLVLATKYPIKDIPGFYFTKLYQETSYVIAITTNMKTDGMYINCENPTISLRNTIYDGQDVILIGGENNRTGEKINLSNKYKSLENVAKSIFTDYNLLFKWNTEDTVSLDKIPYIGEFSAFYKDCYVATGYNKWGMTTSNVAANIILDDIIGKVNSYAYVFHSERFNMIKNRKAFGELLKQSVDGLFLNKIKVKKGNYDNLKNDTGKVIREDGKLIGIFKDSTGKIYKINPKCTHLGCLLHFNELDKTWDCSCHGSRYRFDGSVIYGPSSKDLEKFD